MSRSERGSAAALHSISHIASSPLRDLVKVHADALGGPALISWANCTTFAFAPHASPKSSDAEKAAVARSSKGDLRLEPAGGPIGPYFGRCGGCATCTWIEAVQVQQVYVAPRLDWILLSARIGRAKPIVL